MNRSTEVKGHGLQHEGAPFKRVLGKWVRVNLRGGVGGEGRGMCSCGAYSPKLNSGAARKRWHRDHKSAVAAPKAVAA